MTVSIRPVQEDNYAFVCRLNKENDEVLIPMDNTGLRMLYDKAELFDVVYADGIPAGFIIALREGVQEYDYKSYKWFNENYPKFLYIDQIVIDENYRGRGLGACLYQNAFEHAKRTGVKLVAAAIATDNESGLSFHAQMGFHKVGEQLIRGGTTTISQQMKYISTEK